MLIAADLQRPNAVNQLEVIAERAGVPVFAPSRGNIVGHDARSSRRGHGLLRRPRRGGARGHRGPRQANDVVIVDTAGRLAIDVDLMRQASTSASRPRPTRSSSSSTR